VIIASNAYRVEIDPGLVEEAVLLAVEAATPGERRRFRLERDPLYVIADPEEKEAAFRALHARWFNSLRLSERLFEALGEQPSLQRSASRCLVLPAPSSKEEGADLHEDRQPRPTSAAPTPALIVRLTARTLVDGAALLALLRRELMHAADMLDPAFGYEKALPAPDGGAIHGRIIRERYRVLWDITIDGRLAARGALPAGAEERRRREFLTAFPAPASEVEAAFQRFFEGPRPTHAELAAFATDGGPDAR